MAMFIFVEEGDVFYVELYGLLSGHPLSFVGVFVNSEEVIEGYCAEVSYYFIEFHGVGL